MEDNNFNSNDNNITLFVDFPMIINKYNNLEENIDGIFYKFIYK